ncbi:MAG: FAD-linked oxidase C-terminal domain-containing protein, partial [Bacteroidota bacterium]|nr:FAD-linked oxidase C-terminal domain-containing protein [Bacteroidota bacterium]
EEFLTKCKGDTLENRIYAHIQSMLSDNGHQQEIRKEFPDLSIKRRNTGYAIDLLLESSPFSDSDMSFNFSNLIAGSEGTLALITEIKLNLLPLPPTEKALVCAHFNTLEDAFLGNLIALKHNPGAVELMDDVVLGLTRDNILQRRNRFFLQGDPKAILIIEFARESSEEIKNIIIALEEEFREAGLGYHFPVIRGDEISRVWDLRKAGVGVLSNLPGDAKPVAVIEDTAVKPEDLPKYMEEFRGILHKYDVECVYHAHIGTGELHLRPVLNLKDPNDVQRYHDIALDTASLVKKYNGSLSGEHGDGRLRGQFIPLMIGESNYQLLKEIKKTWDPDGIFNPGKITDTPDMRSNLRYEPGQDTRQIETVFDFSQDQGMMRAVEKCNGSGDCRKSAIIGGTMCPSFMASRDEKDTTRARANILREFLTHSPKSNPFDHQEIYDVMDLCLSCKGCKSECPSNVDITKYKAEFLQHYYARHGIPLRTRAIAYITSLNKLGALFPALFNAVMKSKLLAGMMKKMLGFAPGRSLPLLYKKTLRTWAKHHAAKLNGHSFDQGKVFLFADEFTNYNDTEIGIQTIKLLNQLGYEVEIPKHKLSGRTFLSKGLVRKAKKIAQKNIELLANIVSDDTPLLGIEPSAILTFRDEYKDLVEVDMKEKAIKLSESCLMVDEFIMREMEKGKIKTDIFTTEEVQIKLHGHCYQKSLASTKPTIDMLSIPVNYVVTEIKSGCCGMAGSFGYEKEHFDLSMKVGELVLFPEVRSSNPHTIIAAPGTSCRHQIKDGTGRKALHPVEILYQALNK